jgi:thiamine pyrophosphate-dependent acetolactate synthase large subunit-like protein
MKDGKRQLDAQSRRRTKGAPGEEMADQGGKPLSAIERPTIVGGNMPTFGSDVVAETLRALDIAYIALNPGSSYRGLHDSLVNYLGNRAPQLLLCLHEEHALAIAHGYAKVTGRMMAAALHANVGLFHATMAIFNAWCDRMPVLILGATGPVDAAKRRPWIDWIHTARDQGAVIRPYTKWDDQPASPVAAREALLRAAWIAQTPPMGPVYVNLDAELQESPLADALPPLDPNRFVPKVAASAPDHMIAQAVTILNAAKAPIILIGRVSRTREAWNARVALAEALNARVITDLRVGAAFPTDHPLHAGAPGLIALAPEAIDALQRADAILSLDWIDLAGALGAAFPGRPPSAAVIQVSQDYQLHNGWSMDYQALPPVDLFLPSDPEILVPELVSALGAGVVGPKPETTPGPHSKTNVGSGLITVDDLGATLRRVVGERRTCLTHIPLSWNSAVWPFREPLDYIGFSGGAGLGAGPGLSVGAALALKGSGRLAIAVCGDGDFLMGVTALWTAVHYQIPLLLVVANNQSFFNDEIHQERMARMRDRPVDNKWIGQRINEPPVDLSAMARAQGAVGFGPVKDRSRLDPAFEQAINAVESGAVAVVDVHVEPGYGPATNAVVTRIAETKLER